MNEFLIDLQKAYFNIPGEYFDGQVLHKVDTEKVDIQDIERAVHAELYHQWRSVIDDNKARYIGLLLQSEIGKRFHVGEQSKHPDLVLHEGQTSHTGNRILVELKIREFDDRDIFKCFYALRCHEYSYSVCIIHNYSERDFVSSMREYDIFEGDDKYLGQFYFMNKECQMQSYLNLCNKYND